MLPRTYNLMIRGIALAISVALFVVAMLFLSSVFHMDVLGDLTLLFNEPASYGEWEAVKTTDGAEHIFRSATGEWGEVETIEGVEQVFSSAAGDDPKEVLSPVSYWLGFRGGMSLIIAVFAAIFAYAIGRAVVSAVLRMKNNTQRVVTEVRNGTLVDSVAGSVNDYVEKCKEGYATAKEEGRNHDTYIFGKKYVKGEKKSTIRLVILLVLIAAVVGYFVVMAVI